jgi:hypothetical protein
MIKQIGAPPRGSPKDFVTPVAKIDSPRGESIMPRYALRSDQLRTKAASLILPQMALRLSGIKFLPPERTYSLCVVDPNAGRIGALLIRRVANRFLRQESQNL